MFFRKKILSIDIGTSAIKIVEISKSGNRKKLENYGEIRSGLISNDPLLNVDNEGKIVSGGLISAALKAILKEARIKTRKAVFAVPDFMAFAAFFEIPPMPEKEVPGAIYYSAARYLTLPASEVTLDWRIISGKADEKLPLKIFLIAVPNTVVREYQKIAKQAGLELFAIEPEVFGIAIPLARDNLETFCFLDIGETTSTINISDRGSVQRSYSFDFGGNQINSALSSVMVITKNEAEEIKTTEGILSKKIIVENTLKPLVDKLLAEIKNISKDFLDQEQKQIKKVYLTGGVSNMPGLKDYFVKNLGMSVEVPNCFSSLSHSRILEEMTELMSPSYFAAVGAAFEILDM